MSYLLELNDQIEFAQQRIEEAEKEVEARSKELQELRAIAWFCESCKKYYHKDSVGVSEKEETNTEVVYRDAGYGDDDELAEVTRLFIYNQCPCCGASFKSGKGIYLRETNRRTRR